MPPPAYCGARTEPWRARPVPFCRYGFLPPPRTAPLVLVAWLPCRAAACWATTTWWISGMLTFAPKNSAGSSTFLPPLPDGVTTLTVLTGPPSTAPAWRRCAPGPGRPGDQVPAGCHPGLGEVAGHRLGDPARVDLAVTELHGGIAVGVRGAHRGHHARTRLHDRDRDDLPVVAEDLGHAELGAQNALDVLA